MMSKNLSWIQVFPSPTGLHVDVDLLFFIDFLGIYHRFFELNRLAVISILSFEQAILKSPTGSL